MFFLYSLLYRIATALLLPFEYAKRPAHLKKRWLREKFGFISAPPNEPASISLWIHAVSVGEVLSAVPLIREIEKRHPGVRIALSTITDTGQKIAQERLADSVCILYLPFDLPSVSRRALTRFRPSLFVVMETELWPNLFRILDDAGTPLLILNGRISDRSYGGYRKLRFFMKHVLRHVTMFCMQDARYAQRIIDLGADGSRVTVMGNFKFDVTPPGEPSAWSRSIKGPVIVAGSTHEGEEEVILGAFGGVRHDFPGLTLILAPRHPRRFGEVEDLIRAIGVPYVKRSALRNDSLTPPEGGPARTVILLDTIGELASLYGACDVAIIGGSFVNHGGHNPLEAAFWGKPVVCGPSMQNFPFVDEMSGQGGAVQTDAHGLLAVLRDLLNSPEKRTSMGEKARAYYEEKAGAVERAMKILEGHLKLPLAVSEEKSLP